MTTAHVLCLSHLPTAHEPERPTGPAVADDRPTADANRPAEQRPAPTAVGPMSAGLPRPATCVIPMLR